jgi:hypothetical protein
MKPHELKNRDKTRTKKEGGKQRVIKKTEKRRKDNKILSQKKGKRDE